MSYVSGETLQPSVFLLVEMTCEPQTPVEGLFSITPKQHTQIYVYQLNPTLVFYLM